MADYSKREERRASILRNRADCILRLKVVSEFVSLGDPDWFWMVCANYGCGHRRPITAEWLLGRFGPDALYEDWALKMAMLYLTNPEIKRPRSAF